MERGELRQLPLDELVGGVPVDRDVLERQRASGGRPAIDEARRERLRRRPARADGEGVPERQVATRRPAGCRRGRGLGARARAGARAVARSERCDGGDGSDGGDGEREGRAEAAQIIS